MRYIKNKTESKPSPQEIINTDIPASLDEIKSQLDILYQFCSDIVIREFVFGSPESRGLIVYFDGLVNKDEIENNILRPLLLDIDLLENKRTFLIRIL